MIDQVSEQSQRALLTINRALAAGASSQEVFHIILAQALSLCQAERGFLLDNAGNIITAFPKEETSYSKGVVALILQSGEAMLTIDAADDPRLDGRHSIMLNNIRSVIAAPLQADGQVIGVIYLDSQSNQRNFEKEDLYHLAGLADQAVLAFKLASLKLELEAQIKQVETVSELASTDELTGLLNRRAFKADFQQLMDYGTLEHLSLLMIDVDNFKHYNDRNGHPAGDKALENLAKIFQRGLRGHDLAGRYGGEEFIIALPHVGLDIAQKVAERLRMMVTKADFEFGQHQPLGHMSISLGLAIYPYHGNSFKALTAAADAALYQAKHQGRNQFAVAP